MSEPARAPRFKVGELVYVASWKANTQVVQVVWRKPWHHESGYWEVWVPGHGGREYDFSEPRAEVPTRHFRLEAPNLYRSIETLENE